MIRANKDTVCKLCLWTKSVNSATATATTASTAKPKHIVDIRVSYTKENQLDLMRKNYQMLPLCLSCFGLGYCHIWVLWASSGIVRLTDSDHLETELNDYSKMLERSPDDPILKNMVDQAEWRLRETQLAEEDQAKDISGDDLAYCKQFLALRSSDLRKIKSVFRKKIDLDRDKLISIEDFCSFLREPLSMKGFIRRVFALSSASSLIATPHDKNDPAIFDLGHTVKAITVFCMLSADEIYRLVFASYDTRGFGQIENSQFLELLSMCKLSLLHIAASTPLRH